MFGVFGIFGETTTDTIGLGPIEATFELKIDQSCERLFWEIGNSSGFFFSSGSFSKT